MARYDDDDRGGPYGGTYSDRARSSAGWRDRDWDDEDDSYRRPGGRSLRGQGFADYDEELGGGGRGFSSLRDDDEGQGSWMNGPGYRESHGRDWHDYDRDRRSSFSGYGESSGYGVGARYDDEDNRGRDRYWPGERAERGEWSSQRSRYDDDGERSSYGRGWSSDSERGSERPRSYGRAPDRDDDDDRRGWIRADSSWRRERYGDGRREHDGDGRRDEGRGFAGMDPERRRELASRGGRASARSRRDDDGREGRRSESSRYDDDRRSDSRRGFAAMDPRRQRQIARMGGRASHRNR